MGILRDKVITAPVADITALKALNVTPYSLGVISFVDSKGLYWYNKNSTATPVGDDIVDPNVGSGRWYRITDDLIQQHVDSNFWQTPIINKVDFTTVEPVSPIIEDRYINTVTGTSNVTAQSVVENYIYEWNGSSWTGTSPSEGFATYNISTNIFEYFSDAGTWSDFSKSLSFILLKGVDSSFTIPNSIYKVNSAGSSITESGGTLDDSGKIGITSLQLGVTTEVDAISSDQDFSSATELKVANAISSYIAAHVSVERDWQDAVLDELDFTFQEPVSPSVGDRYINTGLGLGNVTGQAVTPTYIYTWNAIDWTERSTLEGMVVYVKDLEIYKWFNSSSQWVELHAEGLTAVVDDTDPHLGGDLILNGKKIKEIADSDVDIESAGTGDINLNSTTGTGHVVINNQTFPDSAGAEDQALFMGTSSSMYWGDVTIHPVPDQTKILYWRDGGDNAKDGRSIENAKADPAACAAIATATDSVVCLDRGTYTQDFTLLPGASLFAPNIKLFGDIIARNDSSIVLETHINSSGTYILGKYDSSGWVYYKANYVGVSGTSEIFSVRKGTLQATIGSLNASGANSYITILPQTSSDSPHLILKADLINVVLNDDTKTFISHQPEGAGTASSSVYIGKAIFDDGIPFDIQLGRCDIKANSIECINVTNKTFAKLGKNSEMYIDCPDFTGEILEGSGTVYNINGLMPNLLNTGDYRNIAQIPAGKYDPAIDGQSIDDHGIFLTDQQFQRIDGIKVESDDDGLRFTALKDQAPNSRYAIWYRLSNKETKKLYDRNITFTSKYRTHRAAGGEAWQGAINMYIMGWSGEADNIPNDCFQNAIWSGQGSLQTLITNLSYVETNQNILFTQEEWAIRHVSTNVPNTINNLCVCFMMDYDSTAINDYLDLQHVKLEDNYAFSGFDLKYYPKEHEHPNDNLLVSGFLPNMPWGEGTSFTNYGAYSYVSEAIVALDGSSQTTDASKDTDGSLLFDVDTTTTKFGFWEKIDTKTTKSLIGKKVTFTVKMKSAIERSGMYMYIVKYTGSANNMADNVITGWGTNPPTLNTNFAYQSTNVSKTITTSYADYSITSNAIDSDAVNLGVLVVFDGSFGTSDSVNLLEIKTEEGAYFSGYKIRDEVWSAQRRSSRTYKLGFYPSVLPRFEGCQIIFGYSGEDLNFTYNFARTMDGLPDSAEAHVYSPDDGALGRVYREDYSDNIIAVTYLLSEKSVSIYANSLFNSSTYMAHFEVHCKLRDGGGIQ